MHFYQHAYRFFFTVFISIIPVAMSYLAAHLKNVQFFAFFSNYTTRLTNNILFEKNNGGRLCAQSY